MSNRRTANRGSTNRGTANRGTDPLHQARELLKEGKILCVKGIGGFHLACDAKNQAAIDRLRSRKARDAKPFAVMVKDSKTVAMLCDMDQNELMILESSASPIVTLKKSKNYYLAEGVCGKNPRVGIMLAYTPLHSLLFDKEMDALVMTSGNISSEPVCYQDEEAFYRLNNIADGFLTHNREIYFRNDDSVVTCIDGNRYFIRRSRGYVPVGIKLSNEFGSNILAYGSEMKNTFCIAKDGIAYPSHHIGDLEHYEAVIGFEDGIKHFEKIFKFSPQILVADLHPEYISTKMAEQRAEGESLELLKVQHHYAHMLACMADNQLTEPMLGLILDGTGFGEDGSIWGCELLYGNADDFKRIGTLYPVSLPGGDMAVKEPWRMALSWLNVLESNTNDYYLKKWPSAHSINWLINQGGLVTSSAGRLFDAVSALLGICSFNSYEAEAAIKLEWAANRGTEVEVALNKGTEVKVELNRGTDLMILDPREMLSSLVEGFMGGESIEWLAFSFHDEFAKGLVKLCKQSECRSVVLSGGVFQNLLLLKLTRKYLEAEGFKVYIHKNVPCNDGCISLGQCYYAANRIKRK